MYLFPRLKTAYWKVILVVICLAIIGLSTVNQYGVTWDEEPQIQIVQRNQKFIFEGKQIAAHARHHGFLFNFAAEMLFQAKYIASGQTPPVISLEGDEKLSIYKLRERLESKHKFTFIFSLITYLAVAGIASILVGIESAWLAPIVLALMPRFWGHSFFNPKDVPFATLFTLATCLGAYLLDTYMTHQPTDENKNNQAKLVRASIGYGILAGLVTGTRIAGVFILLFILLAHILNLYPLQKHRTWITLYSYRKFYGLVLLYWALTTMIVYPASWFNSLTPIGWFFKALLSMSDYKIWDNSVLFQGKSIPGNSLPWFYLPHTILITVPVVFLIAFLLAIYFSLIKYRQLTHLQRSCIILVLLQIFFIPLLAILRNSTMYDGMRHFLFVLPPIAALATVGLIWSYQKITSQPGKILAVTLLVVFLSQVVIDMIELHPYQYVYFNRISGGLARADSQYETDYWGLSIRDAMEWLNQNANANSKIVVTGPLFATKIFADSQRNFDIIHLDNFSEGVEPNPDYYLGLHRAGYQGAFPECPIVHEVKRQEVSLTTIKQCSGTYN
jgi:hypothetical protein